MTPLLRTAATSVCAAALTVLLVPVESHAQSRVAVSRPVASRPVAHGGGYYRGPAVYPAHYASPYWYGYRPYWWGFYGGYYTYPWALSVGVGFPCCGYPYAYGYYPFYGYPYDSSGSLRLQIPQREAEVFIDGYYAGTVDSFDGTFQRLHVQPGEHSLEVFLPGHRSYQQKVYLQPGKTFNVRHTMQTLGPGEAEPVRPEVKQRPREQVRSSRRQPPIAPPDRDAEPNPDPGRTSPSDFGSLALRVQPGDASITIDGESWENSGDNERLVVQLGPGVHHVQIRKDGYRTYMTDITIRPGETTTLNVAMTTN